MVTSFTWSTSNELKELFQVTVNFKTSFAEILVFLKSEFLVSLPQFT